MSPRLTSLLTRWQLPLAACMLLLHAWLGLSSSVNKSVTADEAGYLLAGHVYWKFSDYRLQPENGILPQRLLGLPAALRGLPTPAPDDPRWAKSQLWPMATDYIHGPEMNTERLLLEARAITMLWSLGTGLLIFFWSRQLHGATGGLLSLCFYCLSPCLLANGALATSDLCLCFLMLASTWSFHRLLRDFTPTRLLLSSLLFGLTCTAKFSAAILPFIFLLTIAIGLITKDEALRKSGALAPKNLSLSLVVHFLGAWLTIWTLYGYRHGAAGPALHPLQQYYHPWADKLIYTGIPGHLLKTASDWHLLPDAYAYGFTFVLDMSQQRSAFLCGEWSTTGWPLFFPICFLIKTPLAFLATCLLGVVAMVCAWLKPVAVAQTKTAVQASLAETAPLWSLLLVYGAVSMTSHLNIGERHLIPLYPVLFIGIGSLAPLITRTRSHLLTLGLAGLVSWQAAVCLSAKPNYLAYFNELVGGSQNGYRYLVDSSLDWGQDLPGLAEWLKKQPRPTAGTKVYLAYFGMGSPSHYGINAERLPWVPIPSRAIWPKNLTPGTYCVSASMLQQVFLIPGPWSPREEQEYQVLRNKRTQTELNLPDEKRFNLLRFARLCVFLRERMPDANINGSILIFNLTEEELLQAL